MAASSQAWTDRRILQALGQWEWAPEGTEIVDDGQVRLLFRPEAFGRSATVTRVESDRPAELIIEGVGRLARQRGFDEVIWDLYPTSRPASLREALLRAGGEVRDEGAVMSLRVPIDGILEVGPVDPAITVRPVLDLEVLTDYRRIVSRVYEQRLPGPDEIAREAAGIAQDKLGRRFVGYLDGEPAGTGALAIRADGSASLFGAATYPEVRGRGVYRAILAARVAWARRQGVPVLLVSGRLATSAPIMERVGFTRHGYTCNIAVPTR